jgi:hypothetical protein
MKKVSLTFVLFLFCSLTVFSQTWTETSGFGGKYVEWMVITKDEWTRLKNQREEDQYFVEIIYADAFEMRTGGVNKVLSGTRPNFNGYYYLYGKWFGFINGWELILAYGNSNTGRMEMRYPQYASEWMNYWAGSDQYWNLYNRYIRRVNGE